MRLLYRTTLGFGLFFGFACTITSKDFQFKPWVEKEVEAQGCGFFRFVTVKDRPVIRNHPDITYLLAKSRELELDTRQIARLRKFESEAEEECQADKAALALAESDWHAFVLLSDSAQTPKRGNDRLEAISLRLAALEEMRALAVAKAGSRYSLALKVLNPDQAARWKGWEASREKWPPILAPKPNDAKK